MSIQEEIATRFTRQERGGAVLVRRRGVEAALIDAERVAALLRDYRGRGLVRSVQSIDAVLPSERTQRARLERYNALPRAAAVEHLRDALQRQGFKLATASIRFLTAFARAARCHRAPRRSRAAALRLRRSATWCACAAAMWSLPRYLDPADGVDWPTARRPAARTTSPASRSRSPRARCSSTSSAVSCAASWRCSSSSPSSATWCCCSSSSRSPARVAVGARPRGAGRARRSSPACGSLGVAIDPVNLIVPPLIVGIGVDDGVYLAAVGAPARQRRRPPWRRSAAPSRSTSLTTIAGFGFLAFSAYPPLATMGRLMAIGLSLCLASTIFVLPALLPDRPPVEAGVSPAPSAQRTPCSAPRARAGATLALHWPFPFDRTQRYQEVRKAAKEVAMDRSDARGGGRRDRPRRAVAATPSSGRGAAVLRRASRRHARCSGRADLGRLPLTFKSHLRDATPFGMLAVPPHRAWHYHETSGTTGEPISTWCGLSELRAMAAIVHRHGAGAVAGRRSCSTASRSSRRCRSCSRRRCAMAGACHIAAGKMSWDVPFDRAVDFIRRLGVTAIASLPLEPVLLHDLAATKASTRARRSRPCASSSAAAPCCRRRCGAPSSTTGTRASSRSTARTRRC